MDQQENMRKEVTEHLIASAKLVVESNPVAGSWVLITNVTVEEGDQTIFVDWHLRYAPPDESFTTSTVVDRKA